MDSRERGVDFHMHVRVGDVRVDDLRASTYVLLNVRAFAWTCRHVDEQAR